MVDNLSRIKNAPAPYWDPNGILNFASIPSGVMSDDRLGRIHSGGAFEEIITIRANRPGGTGEISVLRSVLERSPTFSAYFKSTNYSPASNTSLWLIDEQLSVVEFAVIYMSTRFETLRPYFEDCKSAERMYLLIRLYFLAKRLQLSELEDHIYDILLDHQESIGPKEIIDMSAVIYNRAEEKDNRIQFFFQRRVRIHLRHLAFDRSWQLILRTARPALAADMFNLVCADFLDGDGKRYPTSPPRILDGRIEISTQTKTTAIIICPCEARIHESAGVQNLVIGDVLSNCEGQGFSIVGTTSEGSRLIVPQDHVRFEYPADSKGYTKRSPDTAKKDLVENDAKKKYTTEPVNIDPDSRTVATSQNSGLCDTAAAGPPNASIASDQNQNITIRTKSRPRRASVSIHKTVHNASASPYDADVEVDDCDDGYAIICKASEQTITRSRPSSISLTNSSSNSPRTPQSFRSNKAARVLGIECHTEPCVRPVSPPRFSAYSPVKSSHNASPTLTRSERKKLKNKSQQKSVGLGVWVTKE